MPGILVMLEASGSAELSYKQLTSKLNSSQRAQEKSSMQEKDQGTVSSYVTGVSTSLVFAFCPAPNLLCGHLLPELRTGRVLSPGKETQQVRPVPAISLP